MVRNADLDGFGEAHLPRRLPVYTAPHVALKPGRHEWRCACLRPDGRPLLHYTPAMFDESPYTPYRWPNQPWLSEIGNMHGRGALMCFPDGSIRAMDDVVKR